MSEKYTWYYRAKAEIDWNNNRYDPTNLYEIYS